jgi:N-acetylneuraminate synthase/N,N'-diacetyllegionaminate synthase
MSGPSERPTESPPAGFAIGGRRVGGGAPCFVIAEIGVNHNGDVALAERLIDAAAEAGADAVKFQSFSADRLAVRATPTAAYQRDNSGETDQHAMLAKLELDAGAHRRLLAHSRMRGVIFLSSPFDAEAIDLLDALDVPAFKAPSPDCVSTRYLRHMGAKGRPVILSTGMCDLEETLYGLRTLREAGSGPVALLHCTSCYPAPPAALNLRAMAVMAAASGVPVGYSDHSEGGAVAVAAVALGAAVIEKHLTLDRAMPGPDHRASIEPDAFAAMVADIRTVEAALGAPVKAPQPCEASSLALGRRSLAAARDLPAGRRLAAEDLILLRPGDGLPPRMEDMLIGRALGRAVAARTLLTLDDLA